MTRRPLLGAVLGCVAALTVACGGSGTTGTAVPAPGAPGNTGATSGPSTTAGGGSGGTACEYGSASPAADGRDVGKPAERAADAPATVTLETGGGAVAITLATDRAPCTTRSFTHLAAEGYFDGTPCHRLTAADSLKVLQCGDPTGQGTGGPGYTVPDENPTDLPSAGDGVVVYPRGTVAMANTGSPNSGGSQFFLVYADSRLPPTYAVFGTVDEPGLAVLDAIAAGGIDPQRGETDGAPKQAVRIERAVVGG